MDQEYVVYRSHVVLTKKRELPKVVNVYLCDSIYNPSYSKDINRACRFYDVNDVVETADLLNMEVGIVELKVKPFRKNKGEI
ncbi:hypothetical protein ACWA2C_28230 [Priestia megaterium]